ncbi:hypothetical protein VYU27_003982 [Nannochloropsis oceanica]
MIEVERLKRSMLVRARLLQWRLRARRRPPARWFCGGAGNSTGRDQVAATMSSSRIPSSNANHAAFIDNDYTVPPKLNMSCHHRRIMMPSFIPPQDPASHLSDVAVACPELLEQIFHFVRSRELRAVTLAARPFKYQLDCQEVWRSLYFRRFTAAFGKFKNWKICYIMRDERCDRIRMWRNFFEASRGKAAMPVQ